MTNIMATIEISPEAGGYFVIVSLNGQLLSKHGPIEDEKLAYKVQEEQADFVGKTMRAEIQRLRDHLSNLAAS